MDGKAASRDYIARVIRRASETRADNERFVIREALVRDLDAHTVTLLLERCFLWDSSDGPDLDLELETAAAYISPKWGDCPCSTPRCTGARIIFVTLSLIAREDCVGAFSRAGVCDDSLPFSLDGTQLVGPAGRRRGPLETQAWSMAEKRLFCHFQWAMLSPYFEKTTLENINPKRFDAEACLPWSEYGDALGESDPCDMSPSPSFIRKVKISRHYNNLGYEYLALKGQRSRVQGWESFKNEVTGNVRTAIPHENIVTLLAAFTHAGRSYLLFPWAERGNLVDLWKNLMPRAPDVGPPLPPWCSSDWVWNQSRGLADGLSFIHGFKAPQSPDSPRVVPQLHADIQPRNILCFETRDQGGELSYTLKITDFEFSAPFREPGSTDTIFVDHTAPRYNPPEVRKDEREEHKHVAQNWDVWCLGCVYLEFLSWFLYGYKEGVKNFAKERMHEKHDPRAQEVLKSQREEQTFFRIILQRSALKNYLFHFHRKGIGFEIRRSVIERYQRLKADWHEGRMKRFVELINRSMLVVDKDERATSEAVYQFFTHNEESLQS